MSICRCQYEHARDFSRVRDLLVDTYATFDEPLNWRIERWNYARYFVAPMVGPDRHFCATAEEGERSIRAWEDANSVWENGAGEVVGAVTVEYSWPGEAWFQRHPRHPELLADMLDHAEARLLDPEKRTLGVLALEHDDQLLALVQARGYQRDAERAEWDSELYIEDRPAPSLPAGYRIRSMAEVSDIERRREVFGRAFNHVDPAEWPSAYSYAELQRAPDYRPDLDLFVVGPDDEYASCCIVWYDERNRLGVFEPVGTHPDHRRRGLGRAVVWEGIRRVAALGAKKAIVGSGQEFYQAIGFRKESVGYWWTKRF